MEINIEIMSFDWLEMCVCCRGRGGGLEGVWNIVTHALSINAVVFQRYIIAKKV